VGGPSRVDPAQRFAPAGQSTQLIVGATPTEDREILGKASALYTTFGLRRVYYSAFSPMRHEDPRLPAQAPSLMREHRLYQADWLIRHYGFAAHELTDHAANLSLEMDPKLAWALQHRALFPIDINRAARELLLRVPGLGVRNVDRILRLRRQRALRLADLKTLRVSVRRVAPFVVTADPPGLWLRRLDSEALPRLVRPAEQLELFEAPLSARSGDL
jgi:predicted DNA-binding helix-hairpin-helix protein